MGYMLREGLSFCRVEDRLLFLDLPGDRYFCLAREAEHAVARLSVGQRVEADRPHLVRLARAGLLVEQEGSGCLAPCPAPPAVTHSLLDTLPTPGVIEIAAALLQLVRVRIELRTTGLERTLMRLAHRKQRMRLPADAGHVASKAAAFEASNTLVSAHDRCLPRSLAIAHRLIGVGASPELVLAVKLGPFKAHAWVQCDVMLVNERVEVARRFTPILIL